ncbi:MAG: hypothetical protein AAB545_02050 [Patescibacteria group bacterium]
MRNRKFPLSREEKKLFKKLSTPEKIQDFLDTLRINFEEKKETLMSPRRVLREKKAHCMEGALLASAILWFHGEKPLLLDLQAKTPHQSHALALFKKGGFWGAISKSNHSTVRFRDPVYRTLRELSMSYFNEYTDNDTRKKTLIGYSRPMDLRSFETMWITEEKDLWHIDQALTNMPHIRLIPKKTKLREGDKMERRVGALPEWTSPKGWKEK